MDADPIRARFVLTEDDLLQAFRHGDTKTVRALGAIFFVAAALAAVAAVLSYRRNGTPDLFFVLLTVGILVAAFRTRHLVERHLRRKIEQMPELGRTVTMAVTDDRLWTSVEGISETSAYLSALDRAEAFPEGLLLVPGEGQYAWIPDRAFASRADRDRFLARLRAGLPLPAASL